MSSKSKKIVGILLIAIIIITVLVMIILNVFKKNNGEVEEPNGSENASTETTKSLAETIIVKGYENNFASKNRYVKTSIPSIINLDDKGFQEFVNQKILKTIKDYQDETGIMVDDETPAVTLYKYVESYETYANDRYLSIVVSNDYQTGGMRSNSWKDTYNIDVTKGKNKEVQLRDLFPGDSSYKESILKEINSQATAQGIELVGGNGLSSIPDTQKFYLKDGKLVICFDPAAIAPYVNGELNFTMPFVYSDGRFII